MDFHGTYDGIFSLNFFVQHGLLVDKNSFVHLLEAGGMNLSVLGLQRRTNSPSRNGLPALKMWSFHMVGSWWPFSSTGSEPCHHPLLCQEGLRLCCPPGRCGFCPTRCCCHCLHMTKHAPHCSSLYGEKLHREGTKDDECHYSYQQIAMTCWACWIATHCLFHHSSPPDLVQLILLSLLYLTPQLPRLISQNGMTLPSASLKVS